MQKLIIGAVAALLMHGAFAAQTQTVTLDVKNMNCNLCPITIKKSLERVPGVAEAEVDFAHKTAVVKFDPAKVSAPALVKATTDAGYPSAVRQ